MSLKFGTDGIRGRAYDELTVADVEALAVAAGATLGGQSVVIGTDTRESGPDFVSALCRGFAHLGIESWSLGVAPTPAVAHVAAVHGIAGAMVSASHNPFFDNGIKFFASGGRKLTDDQQSALEAQLSQQGAVGDLEPSALVDRADLVLDYARWVANTVAPRRLDGLSVVVDCANGAASELAGPLLRALGAEVTVLHDQPDGRNINAGCGSTDISDLREAVRSLRADLGIAFDGDADRTVAVAHDGEFVDGDQLIGICALDMRERGTLADKTVVVTVMTNLGFHHGMAEHGIDVVVTPVGDRHVLEALERGAWSLGGEQSGHVIFHDLATTGDGLLTAVQLLDVVSRNDRSLLSLARSAMTRLPQCLRNVTVRGVTSEVMAELTSDIARVSASLGTVGRVLVRPSGTEPLIRVMAEAPTQADADAAVDDLIGVLDALAERSET